MTDLSLDKSLNFIKIQTYLNLAHFTQLMRYKLQMWNNDISEHNRVWLGQKKFWHFSCFDKTWTEAGKSLSLTKYHNSDQPCYVCFTQFPAIGKVAAQPLVACAWSPVLFFLFSWMGHFKLHFIVNWQSYNLSHMLKIAMGCLPDTFLLQCGWQSR